MTFIYICKFQLQLRYYRAKSSVAGSHCIRLHSSSISCTENCSVFSANGDLSGNSSSAALLLFSVYQPGKGALHGCMYMYNEG